MDSSLICILTIYGSVALALLWALINTFAVTSIKVISDEERTSLVYRIKILLDNPDGVLKPGMPADAIIEDGP